jgi:hypothetical protein
MKFFKFALLSILFWACQSQLLDPKFNESTPNYNLVFNNSSLDEISISVTPNDWQALESNLSQVLKTDSIATDKLDSKLLVVPALVRFKDGVWNNVGLKFYTSKNLLDGYRFGLYQLPLELDFDYFGSKFPEMVNQNFHGFSNLILDNQANDNTKIRQVVFNSMLQDLDIITTKNSLKKVKISIGNQNQIMLYTLKEKVEPVIIKNQFNETKFNLYRTNSKLDKFKINDFNRLEAGYLPGFGDVQRLINSVNRRNSIFNQTFDPISGLPNESAWKLSLDNAFDNQMYIRWLALNTTIGNDQFNLVYQEPYYFFSGSNTKANFFYTFPQNSLGLGFDSSISIPEILNSVEPNPLLANIIKDPSYFNEFQIELILLRKKFFTTAYLYPLIDKYYNQIRLASMGNNLSDSPQIQDIDLLKLWIKQRIETLDKSSNEMSIIQ